MDRRGRLLNRRHPSGDYLIATKAEPAMLNEEYQLLNVFLEHGLHERAEGDSKAGDWTGVVGYEPPLVGEFLADGSEDGLGQEEQPLPDWNLRLRMSIDDFKWARRKQQHIIVRA